MGSHSCDVSIFSCAFTSRSIGCSRRPPRRYRRWAGSLGCRWRAALIAATGSAPAAEIDALITTAMKAAIDELVPPFERANGHNVRVSYGPSGGVARRFIGGEPADVIMIEAGTLDELIKQGKVLPGRTN